MISENTNISNYKKWAFRLFIYLIIINIVVSYLVFNYAEGFHNPDKFQQNVTILSSIAFLILLVGSILTFLSVKNKEKKNYQYYFSVFGFPLMIILTLIF